MSDDDPSKQHNVMESIQPEHEKRNDHVHTAQKVFLNGKKLIQTIHSTILVRITRGPGFDPQLRYLIFFRSSVPVSVFLSFDWCVEKNDFMNVFIQSGTEINVLYKLWPVSMYCRLLASLR